MHTVTNPAAIRPWAVGEFKRRDLTVVGDSNGRFNGFGINCGFGHALRALGRPIYASGLLPASTSTATGWGWNDPTTTCEGYTESGSIWAVTGATAVLNNRMRSTVDDLADRYTYYATGTPVDYTDHQRSYIAQNRLHALYLRGGRTMRYHFTYATFNSGSGSFRPCIARSGTTLANGSGAISTNTGSLGVARGSIDYTNSTYNGATDNTENLSFHNSDLFANITGPVLLYYKRLEAPDVGGGDSISLFSSLGGCSMRRYAILVNNNDPSTGKVGMLSAQLSLKIEEMVRLQPTGQPKNLLVIISGGLNDRHETEASVGTAAVADGDSPEAFVDNFAATTYAFDDAWGSLGNDPNNIRYLFVSSQQQNPADAQIASYEVAMAQYAAGTRNVCSVASSRVFSPTYLTGNGFYDDGGQPHMENIGYIGWCRGVLQTAFEAASSWRARPARVRLVR